MFVYNSVKLKTVTLQQCKKEIQDIFFHDGAFSKTFVILLKLFFSINETRAHNNYIIFYED